MADELIPGPGGNLEYTEQLLNDHILRLTEMHIEIVQQYAKHGGDEGVTTIVKSFVGLIEAELMFLNLVRATL